METPSKIYGSPTAAPRTNHGTPTDTNPMEVPCKSHGNTAEVPWVRGELAGCCTARPCHEARELKKRKFCEVSIKVVNPEVHDIEESKIIK